MKKVLVTGATGFVGQHVINALQEKDCTIVATSSSREKAVGFDWFSKVEYKPFDLAGVKPDEDYFSLFGKPDVMIHLAWEGLPNYKASFHTEENLPRHFQFLDNMVQGGLKSLTVTGTCFEYGLQEGCLREDMDVFPGNFYAQAKNELRIRLEQLAADQALSFKWIRLFYMFGKGQNPNSLLSQLQAALDRGDEVFNMSPGDQLRDYLPIETVARNIVNIAMQDQVTGVVNCCSGEPVQVKDLVQEYLDDNNATIKLNRGFYPYSDLEPRNFWGDTTKLKTILR